MKNIFKELKDTILAILAGMEIALLWYWKTIKNEEKIYGKIIYMILFIIDMILIPVKAIIVTIGWLKSKKFREEVIELADGVIDEVCGE